MELHGGDDDSGGWDGYNLLGADGDGDGARKWEVRNTLGM